MKEALLAYLESATTWLTVSAMCWSLGTLVMWGYTTFDKKEMQPVPESLVVMVSLTTSGLLGNRFLQIKEALKEVDLLEKK